MGRGNRKDNRQAHKKTKLDASIPSSQRNSNAHFAPPVFAKNQFSTLLNKGKARQQGQQQQPNHAEPSGTIDDNDHAMQDSSRVSNAQLNMAGIQSKQDLDLDPANASLSTTDSLKFQLDPTLSGKRDSSIKAYAKELHKLIDNADVLLEVLDARDPIGCRSLETERMLLRAGKKVVLILNKIDLVPKSNVEGWLKYLRHDFPTLAFKASTQSQRTNLSQGASSIAVHRAGGGASSKSILDKDSISGGAEAMGAGALLQLIKNYSRNLNLKTSITVGIFGAPNVGKSSLINSLKRARVCSVAATPGHTKVVQAIMLDKSVRLLDCPGIVFSDETGGEGTHGSSLDEIRLRQQSALLRNVVKVELVEDPITPVEVIMSRVDDAELAKVYGLEFFQSGNAQDFLMRIAVQRGRIGRGGILDLEATARTVLHDWNVGKIRYYTNPPALHRSAILSDQSTQGLESNVDGTQTAKQQLEQSSAILSSYSEAFDLAGLLGEADAEIFATFKPNSALVPEPPKPRFAPDRAEEAEEIVNDHEQQDAANVSTASVGSTLGKRSRGFLDSDREDDDDDDDDEDEDDDLHSTRTKRRPVVSQFKKSVPGLTQHDDDDDDDNLPNDNVNVKPQPFTFETPKDTATLDWQDRQTAKATGSMQSGKRNQELSTVFSAQELEGLAASRGAQRRKVKKLKKRMEKSGAGLVQFIEASMDLGNDVVDNHDTMAVEKKNLASQVATTTSLAKKGTGSMFDLLMPDEGDGEDEPAAVIDAEKPMQSVVATVNIVTEQDDAMDAPPLPLPTVAVAAINPIQQQEQEEEEQEL